MDIILIQWSDIKSQIISFANDTAIALPVILIFALALAYATVYAYLRFFNALELRRNKRKKAVNKNKVDKNKPDAGTAFVEEGGQVVRRSLRQRKKDESSFVTPQNKKIKSEVSEDQKGSGSKSSGSQIQLEQKVQSEQRAQSTRGKSNRLTQSTSRLSKNSTVYQTDTI